ncbi:hypothetical protein DEJ16_13590 [Curtobacterium sp. MCJR17_055]|uniref:GOLPH3/VPS74 family protein n=1 Tax=unclassified Curtobacterium TaxID=257496 RepID=UPI000D907777|nr:MULTISPECIES: GPP34 family phosphoprotein [unclassified Curtobacterium]PYY32848.1 hypothetical protein DEI87_13890 [Curtobacterium sp. MCBD17_029]PYY54102.1 hypothetical protein DEJ16_13590 [Curtobacterium sp. MCJR17_055]PYY55924.1 hypothetical protein DEJ26_14485 [Curtobacterium sp. MCPF17_015]
MPASLTLPQAFALLLVASDGRRIPPGQVLDAGLAGAALGELALRGMVSLDHNRVIVAKAPPPGDPALDGFLTLLETAPAPRRPTSWVARLGNRGFREAVLNGLVARGVLGREEKRFLAVFPSVRWPERDAGPAKALRAEVSAVLRGQAEPTPFTSALIGLLQATRTLRPLFGTQDRALLRRITEGDWVAAAVRTIVQRAQSAGGGADGADGGDGGGGDGGGGGGGE